MNQSAHRENPKHTLDATANEAQAPVQHGTSFGFNPEAREFTPGCKGTYGPNVQRTGSQDAVEVPKLAQESRKPIAKAQAKKGEGGGLSRAFAPEHAHGPRRAHARHHTQQPEQGSSHRAAARPSDVPVLGRSPSRTFVPANHLLNFHYERASGWASGSRGRRKAPGRQQPYDRNKFLQANFRFLVSDAADLRGHAADADLMLDWSDVIEVELLVNAPLRCPISLEAPPLCPQITPCGHVFAFPAIMGHLLTHGGDALRKASPCPLCLAPIAARELRLVRTHQVAQPKVGEEIVFALIRRPRHSIIAVEAKPQELQSPHTDHGAQPAAVASRLAAAWPGVRAAAGSDRECEAGRAHGRSEAPRYNRFAKFTQLADPQRLWACAAEDLAAYAAEVTAAGGRDAAQEAPYIYAAIDALAARAASFAERRQRALQDAAAEGAEVVSPQEAAATAAATVKQITNAAVASASEGRKREAEELARLSDFPALTLAQPSEPAGPSGLSPPPASGTRSPEAAFTDEDSPRLDGSTSPQSQLPGREDANGASSDIRSASADNGSIAGRGRAQNSPPPLPDEVSFYQAATGQWLFLHPLLMRILLEHWGSYDALPAAVAGRLLALEPQVQSEALRRRNRILGHLPLGGEYALCEIDLGGLLPAGAVQPFAKELAARAARRDERAAVERMQEERDAARAAALLKATAGPTEDELKAMPRPGAALGTGRSESEDFEEAVALSLADGADGIGGSPPPALPQSGVSFARMAELGYGASGPALSLSTTPPAGRPPVWGPRGGATPEPTPAPHFGSYPPREPVGGPSAWGGRGQPSAAARLAEAEAARHNGERAKASAGGGTSGTKAAQPRPTPPAARGKKAGKQILVFGVHNGRY